MIRNKNNPILTRKNIPDIEDQVQDVTSVFNPGAIKFKDQYLLLLRVQKRSRETITMVAKSDDGVNFEVENKIVEFKGIEKVEGTIYHCYDPRITQIDDQYYVMFAMDMEGKCGLGLARTEDFEDFYFMGIVSEGDVRNGVLFPEKIDGQYLRLERPNKVALDGGPTSGSAIHIASSQDLLKWEDQGEVMSGRPHYWDERIGSGPPPVKTRQGWLHLYHGIAEHFGAASIYQGGVTLLDLNDPSKLIARSNNNILEPRKIWELAGQVPNVVFPSGMIVEEYDRDGFAKLDSKVYIYYGAADTVIGLAESSIQQLIDHTKQ